MKGWYDDLAESLRDGGALRDPLEHDSGGRRAADRGRAPRPAASEDGKASATAVRMIWTGDHLDAARRLQRLVIEPARRAAEVRA